MFYLVSILAHICPCYRNSQRVSNYKHHFNELNIQGFDFSNGFKDSDVHKFNKLNNSSVNIFEKLKFYLNRRFGSIED